MLSRVAESIFWMNRYIERAENYARFLDVNYNLSLESSPDLPEQWLPLVLTSGDAELYDCLYGEVSKSKVIRFLGFDPKNPNSVLNCITFARENARSVRTDITREMWEQINQMYFFVKEANAKRIWQRKDPRAFFNELKKGCHLLYGIIDATISRNEGWHFGSVGRLIERADKTSRILDVRYHYITPSKADVELPIGLVQWSALLKSVSALDMYRRENGSINPKKVVRFLILDEHFPRAIYRCITHVDTSLKLISEGQISKNGPEAELQKIKTILEASDIEGIFQTGLHEFLDNIQVQFNNLTDEIAQKYFSKKL